MIYYVFFVSQYGVSLIEKFNNKNDFIEYYINKRMQCLNDKQQKNIDFDIMPVTSVPITKQIPMFFKKKIISVYIDNQTTLTYYAMRLPKFCNKFFEKLFCSFIKL